jgi:hypothetical protein
VDYEVGEINEEKGTMHGKGVHHKGDIKAEPHRDSVTRDWLPILLEQAFQVFAHPGILIGGCKQMELRQYARLMS